MQIEEKFTLKKASRRRAALVDVLLPIVRNASAMDEPTCLEVEFMSAHGTGHDELRTIAMTLTPLEALELAEQLTAGARKALAASQRPVTARQVRVRTPIVELEGRPIFESDTLYDSAGERMIAHAGEQGFALLMLYIDHDSDSKGGHTWSTDTHHEGKQVLFWNNPQEATGQP